MTAVKAAIIIRIVCWSLLALALAQFMVYGIVSGGGIFSLSFFGYVDRSDFKEVHSKDVAMDGAATVTIRWPLGNVRVVPSDEGFVSVTQKSNDKFDGRDEARVSMNGSELTIDCAPRFRFSLFGWGSPPSDLEIALPASFSGAMRLYSTSGDDVINGEWDLSELTVESTSGNVQINALSATQVNLRITSGGLSATDISGQTLSCRVTSGNMSVAGEFSSVATDQTSGGIEMSGIKAQSFDAKTTSGRLTVRGEIAAINAKATSGSMSFDTSVPLEGLSLKLTSGNISVAMPDSDGFTLDVKRTSGNVDTDFPLSYTNIDRAGVGTYKNGGPAYFVDMTSGSVHIGMKS